MLRHQCTVLTAAMTKKNKEAATIIIFHVNLHMNEVYESLLSGHSDSPCFAEIYRNPTNF